MRSTHAHTHPSYMSHTCPSTAHVEFNLALRSLHKGAIAFQLAHGRATRAQTHTATVIPRVNTPCPAPSQAGPSQQSGVGGGGGHLCAGVGWGASSLAGGEQGRPSKSGHRAWGPGLGVVWVWKDEQKSRDRGDRRGWKGDYSAGRLAEAGTLRAAGTRRVSTSPSV